ncbi:MAG TPA: hypothetical protein VIM12_15975 [Noviherbaspirillum sp.]|jgi:hypothetical protein
MLEESGEPDVLGALHALDVMDLAAEMDVLDARNTPETLFHGPPVTGQTGRTGHTAR